MAYTDDEIQAAVTKLVLSTISTPYDTLGVRRTDLSFSDIQQAAAQVFVLYPNAPFYVCWLGVQRLGDQITAEAALLDQLVAALQAVGRQVLPVTDVSPLFNAQSALQSLGTATRSSTFSNVNQAPAFAQFSASVQTFLGTTGQAVKSNGDIVQTPQQARGVIPGLVTQITAAHAALVASVTGLAGGIVDYGNVNLPAIVAQSVIANSAALLGADATALQALTPDARLALVRQTVLDVLTTQAAVQTFGSFAGPSDFYPLTGTGSTFSDMQHLATPALAQANKSGGVAIISGVSDDLNVTDSGGAPFDLLLNPSVLAELDGTADDSTFVIGDGTSPAAGVGFATPTNNVFKVRLDPSGTIYTANLTLSGGATAALMTGTGDLSSSSLYGPSGSLNGAGFSIVVDSVQTYTFFFFEPADVTALLSQINQVTQLGGHVVTASSVGNRLQLVTASVGTGASILVGNGTSNSLLGVTSGQLAKGTGATLRTADQVAADIQAAMPAGITADAYYSPLNFSGPMDIPAGTHPTFTLTGGAVSDLVGLGVKAVGYTVHVLAGPNAGIYPITAVTSTSVTVTGTFAAGPGTVLEIGPVNRRVRVRATSPSTQLPIELTITVFGDTPASRGSLNTLGFFNGLFSQCRLTTPDQVAANINGSSGTIVADTATIPVLEAVVCRSDILNGNQVTFARGSVTGSAAFAGTTLTFAVTAAPSSSPLYVPYAPLVDVGDVVVLRDGMNPGAFYTVTSVNGLTAGGPWPSAGAVLAATGTVAGTATTGVNAEVGPSITASKYQVVSLFADPNGASSLPGPNGGDYFVSGQGATPIDVLLVKSLPLARSGAGPVTMGGSFGNMFLTLASKNTTAQSGLVLQGTAAGLFFTAVPHTQLGSSPWFKLPSIPRGLQGGDVFEYYPTDYTTPSASFVIQQVIAGLNVIQVSPDVPDGLVLSFTTQPVPFGRLRVGVMNDFGAVQGLFNAWLANSVNQPLFFQNFNRLINPLLANQNPTAAQVGAALNSLLSLYAFLTAAQATAQGQPMAQTLDSINKTFTIEPVAAVDTLIASFIAKGSDKAVDTLLSGSFTGFFGLSAEGSSYAGAFQAATRSVAMNDLPVSRYNRPETQGSSLVAQTASPDYEYTGASLNENLGGPQVDPPQITGTPSNYGTTTGSTGAGGR